MFDTHYFFHHYNKTIEHERLRLAFIIYGAINRRDWRTISVNDIAFTEAELKNQLAPVLSRNIVRKIDSFTQWASTLVNECRKAIAEYLLPLKQNEIEFLHQLNDQG